MSLAETQKVLAQLYTSTELRSRFFSHPQTVGTELGLSTEEGEQLAQLSQEQVNLFANSLKWKRLGEVRELLPLTQRVMGKEFTQWFWCYAETYLPTGIKKHRDDAIAFATFLEQVAGTENRKIPPFQSSNPSTFQPSHLNPPWVGDLLRYEKSWLQAAEPTRRFTVCRFRYAINPLVGSLRRGDEKPLLIVQPTVAFWLRLAPRFCLRHLVVSLPF